MPDPRGLFGRALELAGWAACLGGLALAFWLVAGERLPGGQSFDPPLAATLIGTLCLLPGIGLILTGTRFAGARALSPGWISALIARRGPSPRRTLAVLVCGLIAALCLAAIAALWPEISAAFH